MIVPVISKENAESSGRMVQNGRGTFRTYRGDKSEYFVK